MANFSLSYRDELDLAQVIFAYRALIAQAIHGGLPTGFYTKEGARQVSSLLAASDILDDDLKLCSAFRTVLADVLGGRHAEELTAEDCRVIAARSEAWHPNEFGRGWGAAVYNSR